MEPDKSALVNFENIERVAAFIIMPDGLGVDEKVHELQKLGYADQEIDIGSKMAIQVCLMVIFNKTHDVGGPNWKKPVDPTA